MWRGDSLEMTLMLGKIEGGGEGDDRGWDVWIASLIQWTWVWTNSRRQWRTEEPGVLWSMWLQSHTGLLEWTRMQPVGSKFPNQGSNLGPQQRKCQVLTTGSPENSPSFLFVDERTVLSPAEQKSASRQATPQRPWSLLSSQSVRSPGGAPKTSRWFGGLPHLSRGASKGPIFASAKLGSVSVACNHKSRLP